MRIAICDDDAVCRGQTLDIATDYAEARKDIELYFETFAEPRTLLEATRKKGAYDIYILDIVMPEINGIELGKALRSMGADGKIIYLTSSEEYALDSFRVRAFDYILKPIAMDSFYAALDEAISSVSIKRDKVLLVKTRENNARIAFDSILYAELSRRTVIYHLIGGKKVESTTLRTAFTEAVAELITDRRFVLCGASTAVNLHHVTAVESEGAVFSDGERIMLGKKACRELRTAWNDYWITKEG